MHQTIFVDFDIVYVLHYVGLPIILFCSLSFDMNFIYRLAQKSISWLVKCTLKYVRNYFIT
jgi:hypothetical protein